MVKGKSSASSGTRKKHARKAAGASGIIEEPIQKDKKPKKEKGEKGGKKGAKKEPRQKVYIPPVKPAPVQPDPLETTGLAHRLPPELLVVLRSLSKKAIVTKAKALEDLQASWVNKSEEYEAVLLDMLPVWLHHVPSLFLHPSRRIRSLAAGLHSSFLHIPSVKDQILFSLTDLLDEDQVSSIVGTWCITVHDIDRAVSSSSSELWNRHLVPLLTSDSPLLKSLESFIRRAILDPHGVYVYLNPAPPSAPALPPGRKGPGGRPLPTSRSGTETPEGAERSKADALEESEMDRRARIRVGALGSMRWILEQHPNQFLASEDLSFFSNPALWSILHHAVTPPFLPPNIEGFGAGQPIVRKSAWALVQSVLKASKDKPQLNEILPILSTAILRSAFVEQDSTVQAVMWQPLLVFLKEVRDAWRLEMKYSADHKETGEAEEDSEDEDDDDDAGEGERHRKESKDDGNKSHVSQAYQEFLQFLQLGCSGSPMQGYPTVVVILSTIPSEVIAASTPSLFSLPTPSEPQPHQAEAEADTKSEIQPETQSNPKIPSNPLMDLFTSFWAAIDGRALSSLQRSAASSAFLSSLLECMVFLIRRVWRDLFSSTSVSPSTSASGEGVGLDSTSSAGYDGSAGVEEPKNPKHASLLLFGSSQAQRSEDGHENENREQLYLSKLQEVMKSQIERVWSELSDKTLKIEERVAGVYLARTLLDFIALETSGSEDQPQRELYGVAWEALANGIRQRALECPGLVSTVLSVFLSGQKKDSGNKNRIREILEKSAKELLKDILEMTIGECEGHVSMSEGQIGTGSEKEENNDTAERSIQLLVAFMQTFSEALFAEPGFTEASILSYRPRIDNLLLSHGYTILSKSPILFKTYLIRRNDAQKRLECWQNILAALALRHSSGSDASVSVLSQALDVLGEAGPSISSGLRPKAEEIDPLVGRLLAESMNGTVGSSSAQVSLVRRIFTNPAPILSESGFSSLLQSLASAFSLQIDSALRSNDVSMNSFVVVLDLLEIALVGEVDMGKKNVAEGLVLSVIPDVFLLAFLFPKLGEEAGVFVTAKRVWEKWTHDNEGVYVQLKDRLKELLGDTQVRFSPSQIVQTLSALFSKCRIDPIHELVEADAEFNAILVDLPSDPIDPSLAVLDPLIPPASSFSEETVSPPSCDTHGYSYYARLVIALLHIALDNRRVARENMWILRHLLALSQYAEDLLNIPTGQSPVFSRAAIDAGNDEGDSEFELGELVVKIQQIVTYALTSATTEGWRLDALSALDGKESAKSLQPHAQFLVDVIRLTQSVDTARECRVLYNVLQHVMDDIEKDEAESWVSYARKIEKSAPQTSMTIVAAISHFAPEPPRLERYRNELAASLLGIPPTKVDTEGLQALRKLAAAAPDSESGVAFLPPQRAINVVKSCEQWVGSDEDISEEVECAMTLTFFHLAPILQNVSGAHWAFIFDVIENNLENCSMTDDTTWVTMARTLRLVILIRDLALTNKGLHANWAERETAVLTLIRNFATSQLESQQPSAPGSACRELVLSIVQDLPSGLIDHETLPKMCHLLSDPSVEVQKMAYQLLLPAAKKRTEHLVIEAGIDTEDKVKAELPSELMVILEQTLSLDLADNEQDPNLFGHFLGWMLLFDLFTDTSLRVRVSYIDQLRSSDIIGSHFIPTIFSILGIDQGIAKTFKLDMWGVDEYYMQFYESGPSKDFSLKVFAAHLYYRALLTVPSLIHNWVLECKDRQLSSSVATYTSTHFSPLIIKAELAHVKNPESASELADENLTIKVSSLTNEVAASYLVDEHQLEIRLKIPTDWPLHRVEIKDVKRVGVDENRWRAWLLAVQQTIWAQNGRIVDGLALFKKNVTLHFEGQVECAICYSIISVMDGSLPKKPCKTCKNRFHAGCLFKWFNSSHSSSCPLCRSDILH
ncbi:hypothetical protein D9758_006910 [Tetrapyrgos nigripes]|uniref:E3 ubiquitin-protein ligase listerin n=1 Tax=Tetrapyrgos nigripes TaxID=182062 RepID=A0A8H5GSQ6_9AGAR|nr:hypothetical protein D9758_006910 [Tetrapyrgos nigripes]